MDLWRLNHLPFSTYNFTKSVHCCYSALSGLQQVFDFSHGDSTYLTRKTAETFDVKQLVATMNVCNQHQTAAAFTVRCIMQEVTPN